MLLAGCEQHRKAPAPPPKILGTYAKDCATPPPAWRGRRADLDESYWAQIGLDGAGQTSWNGNPASIEVIRGYLHQFDGPKSQIAFVATADAKCADVVAIRRMISELAMCRQPGRCVEGGQNLPSPVY